MQDDPDYRRAIADADLAIADSGWAVLFWRLLRREKLTRISGLALFKALLETADARVPKNLFWVLPSDEAKTKTLEFAGASRYPVTAEDCYVAPKYALLVHDLQLVSILEQRKPNHIIIGIGGGMQDKLGSYLKHQLSYRPAIYCIGAAPRLRYRRPSPNSDVGRPIFHWLDISPDYPPAKLLRSVLEGAACTGFHNQVRQRNARSGQVMERDSERKFELHRCLSILVSPPMEYQRRQLTPCGDGACL